MRPGMIVGIGFLLGISVCSFAQKGWEIGAWVGVSYYIGDLNTNFNLKNPGPAGGLNGRYNFNERICTKFSLNYGYVSAKDSDSDNFFERQRNLSFRSHIIELNSQLEFNFLPYVHGSSDFYFTPYIMTGISVFRFDPTATLNGQSYKLRNYGTEGQPIGGEYRPFNGAISFGGGFKWDIDAVWSINIEIGTRQVFTDYLDDASKTYPDLQDLADLRGDIAVQLSDRSLAPGIGENGRQRGNSRDNDSYNFIGISIMKYFGRLECPKISKF